MEGFESRLSAIKDEVESRVLSAIKAAGANVNSSGGAKGGGAAKGAALIASALSSSMLLASRIDAAAQAAHDFAGCAAEARGVVECAEALRVKFPQVDMLWGVAAVSRYRLETAEVEAQSKRAEADSLAAQVGRLHADKGGVKFVLDVTSLIEEARDRDLAWQERERLAENSSSGIRRRPGGGGGGGGGGGSGAPAGEGGGAPSASLMRRPSVAPPPTAAAPAAEPAGLTLDSISTFVTSKGAAMRARVAEVQAALAAHEREASDLSDSLQRASQAVGSLRLLSSIERREAQSELRTLRLERREAMKPVLLCRHRARLAVLVEEEDFLSHAVAYAEGLQRRELVRRVEAEATLLLTGTQFSIDTTEVRGFDDGVGFTLCAELMAWLHADPEWILLRVASVEEPGKNRWLLTVQIMPSEAASSGGAGSLQKGLDAVAELLKLMENEVGQAGGAIDQGVLQGTIGELCLATLALEIVSVRPSTYSVATDVPTLQDDVERAREDAARRTAELRAIDKERERAALRGSTQRWHFTKGAVDWLDAAASKEASQHADADGEAAMAMEEVVEEAVEPRHRATRPPPRRRSWRRRWAERTTRCAPRRSSSLSAPRSPPSCAPRRRRRGHRGAARPLRMGGRLRAAPARAHRRHGVEPTARGPRQGGGAPLAALGRRRRRRRRRWRRWRLRPRRRQLLAEAGWRLAQAGAQRRRRQRPRRQCLLVRRRRRWAAPRGQHRRQTV